MPASSTTCRPPRSRTWRTRATSQPARATSARPGSIASRVGRRSAGMASRSAGSSRANRAGVGDGFAERPDREPAAHVERVEVVDRAAPRARSPRAPAGRRRARRRPRPVATRRGGGCRAGEADRRLRHRPRWPRRSRSRSSRTSSYPRRPRGPRCVSGRDVGIEAEQDVERGAAGRAPRRAGPRAAASSADSSATQRSGRAVAAARTAARRSAAVLPTPSSVIRVVRRRRRAARPPTRRARPRWRPNPRAATARDDRRDVVRLDRVLAQPRVGEGVADRRGRVVERGQVRDVTRASRTGGRRLGAPRRSRGAGRASLSRGPPCATIEPHDADRDAAEDGRHERVDAEVRSGSRRP